MLRSGAGPGGETAEAGMAESLGRSRGPSSARRAGACGKAPQLETREGPRAAVPLGPRGGLQKMETGSAVSRLGERKHKFL